MKTQSIRQAVAATVLLVLASAALTSLSSTPAQANDCPATLGFWKNHPSCWTFASCRTGGACLTLGGQSYTETELIAILTAPVAGNAALNLAHQLIAADVNIATGSVFGTPAFVAIQATIVDANNLLSGACGSTRLPSCNVAVASATGQNMVADAAFLDQFNEGRLTPVCTARTTPGCTP